MSVTQSVQVGGREKVFMKLASMHSDNRKRERERESIFQKHLWSQQTCARAFTRKIYRLDLPNEMPFNSPIRIAPRPSNVNVKQIEHSRREGSNSSINVRQSSSSVTCTVVPKPPNVKSRHGHFCHRACYRYTPIQCNMVVACTRGT